VSAPQRVVSLLPAATEMVCALGAGERLVGRSHECDVPAWVQALPACSRARVAAHAPAAETHAGVAALLREGLSVYEVLADRLRALEPDLVVTQVQCAACAVTVDDVERALATFTGERPALVSLEPQALRDVLADVQRVADALGVAAEGERLRGEMRRRMRAVDARANGIPGAPAVACIEWIEPLMVAGNWVPELVDLAGGDDRLGTPGAHSPRIDWQQLRDADPDLLVIMPCGFDLARTLREASALAALPGWPELAAVRNGQVFAVDGHRFFNRPGPRLVESLEILAEIFHPERFDFGHRGTGWQRLA